MWFSVVRERRCSDVPRRERECLVCASSLFGPPTWECGFFTQVATWLGVEGVDEDVEELARKMNQDLGGSETKDISKVHEMVDKGFTF